MVRLSVAVAAAACSSASAGLSFITIGDWGAGAVEEPSKPYAQNVKDVAAQMARSADENSVQFIVNTGDNFYWCGIQNVSDYQVQKSWLEPYAAAPLQVPWYSVLGNHEYGYNVDAQVGLSSIYSNWVMDARYFKRRLPLEGENYATLIFLDTSPCISQYRGSDKSRWDPCGSSYPTCDPTGGSDIFEGECHFNANILSQDCSAQLDWFAQALADVPEEDWLIVVGHHPAYEIDVADMTATMQKRGVDLYLNGHSHVLTHYTVDGQGAYLTSGAGSLVLTNDQEVYLQAEALGVEAPSTSGHSHKTVFSARTSGFTLHKFSDDYSSLTTELLDTSGKILHSFTVAKGASPTPTPSPSPSPSPTRRRRRGSAPTPVPAPSPEASCASLGCGAYSRSNPCQCNSACKTHNDCCDDYDAVCSSTVTV